jgi:hypothetical protein
VNCRECVLVCMATPMASTNVAKRDRDRSQPFLIACPSANGIGAIPLTSIADFYSSPYRVQDLVRSVLRLRVDNWFSHLRSNESTLGNLELKPQIWERLLDDLER